MDVTWEVPFKNEGGCGEVYVTPHSVSNRYKSDCGKEKGGEKGGAKKGGEEKKAAAAPAKEDGGADAKGGKA